MGQDKSLLKLAGKPLIEHAVTKLKRLCTDVSILTNNPDLAIYAPIVPDLHPGCGPMSGMEAALLHSKHDWNLILPVDLPFLTTLYLESWIWTTLRPESTEEIRISMISHDAQPQPALLILHRDIAPYLTQHLEAGKFKLLAALKFAASDIAAKRSIRPNRVFLDKQDDDISGPNIKGRPEPWWSIRDAQRNLRLDEFANLNTPEDFSLAELFVDALDT